MGTADSVTDRDRARLSYHGHAASSCTGMSTSIEGGGGPVGTGILRRSPVRQRAKVNVASYPVGGSPRW